MRAARRALLLVAVTLVAACGGGAPSLVDGGLADGSSSVSDGGVALDGGPPPDGSVDSDGGVPGDGGEGEPSDLLGAGFTGGACARDIDCGPAGATCLTGVSGGTCIVSCTSICTDRQTPYAPVTFCIDKNLYEERLGESLGASADPGVCVSKCDFGAFPTTGCRAAFHCERRARVSDASVLDEVCVPGSWTVGLSLSPDGTVVRDVLSSGPSAGEPYASLALTRCGSKSTADVPVDLFVGFARFLLAAGSPAGWERLCDAPADLPDLHGTAAEAAAGLAFRLLGSRQELIDRTGIALYGTRLPRVAGLHGPLWGSRVLIRSDASASRYFLYAGGTPDRPYVFAPSRGRHFGVVGANEWHAVDTALEPDREFRLVKANGGAAYTRQWARATTIEWLAGLGRAYLGKHGIPLGVGDLSLPTGGTISDHSSHQVGTDIDVYLLTFDKGGAPAVGGVDFSRQELWVSTCTQSNGTWTCRYTENASGIAEVLGGDHLSAASLLKTLAEHAFDHPGPSWFVQNDVNVLAPIRAMRNHDPIYIDASNVSGSGWPPHLNHAHIRLVPP